MSTMNEKTEEKINFTLFSACHYVTVNQLEWF